MTITTRMVSGDPSRKRPDLAVSVAGSGPPVIFLHGIGGNRTNWQRQLEATAPMFNSFAWDARGYGDSGDQLDGFDFSSFGDDLVDVLDALEIERAHLVGLSMGARTLLDLQPRHPDRVATLTLCDCFYGFETALSPEQRREYLELRERPLLEGKTFADLAPKLVSSLVGPNCAPEIRAELHDSILKLRAESYLATLRASVTFDRSAALDDIEVPVQLVYGEHDALSPPSIGEEMLDRLPNARLDVIDDAGHLSNLEQPERFNDIVCGFLAEHADAATWRSRT